jgi:hypothetical protein
MERASQGARTLGFGATLGLSSSLIPKMPSCIAFAGSADFSTRPTHRIIKRTAMSETRKKNPVTIGHPRNMKHEMKPSFL